jgi:hypothetical protein
MTYDEILNTKTEMYSVNLVEVGFKYWQHFLLEKCFGMFTYEGLPDSLPAEQIETRLVMKGWCGIFKHQKYGIVTSYGGLSGVDQYFLPLYYVYAQPALGSKNLNIGKDCIIMYNSQVDQYNRQGLLQLISRYARMLADIDSSISISTVNTRNAKVDVVTDKTVAKTVDNLRQAVSLGKTYSVNQDSLIDKYKTMDFNSDRPGQIAELINLRADTIKNFLAEIGVKTASDKKERMITDEVQEDNQLMSINVEDMLHWRKKGVEQINKMFGTEISVEQSPAYKLKER